jgi:putative membrane protein
MTTLFAFLHHLAAFALVAALAVELVLIRGELGAATMRKIVLADMIVGLSAFGVLQRTVRRLIHAELAGIVLILLFAAMMARGVGFFG